MIEALEMDAVRDTIYKELSLGRVFLTTKDAKPNTMVISWGGITEFWGKTSFFAPIRHSRYSHDPIAKTGEFTVSFPLNDDLKEALKFCGSKSGRDHDKFDVCALTPVEGQTVSVPVIGECALHIECRVILKPTMGLEQLLPDIKDKWYADNDCHTFFFGEILACYKTK